MKLLMLAWRDMKHPQKGGAEVVTDIYLSGLAKRGHDVSLFSSYFPNAEKEENYNGYKIIRQGGKLGVYIKGLKYAKKHQEELDIIIDQVNTIPFFTPLLIKKSKRIAYFNQLCKNVWFYEAKFPIADIGYILESIYLKFYKNTRIITISDSSKQDLIKYCHAKPENIIVLEMNVDFPVINIKNLPKILKTKKNQFVFCGRIVKSKRVHDCIKALNLINNKETKLYIIGDGDKNYKEYLNKLIEKLNLKDRIIFTGRIPQGERNKIMQESQAILVTSVREGWGLIVTEANANGTLAITYNVEGLRDANKEGLMLKNKKYNTPKDLAEIIDFVLDKANKNTIIKKTKNSLQFAKQHSNWNKTVEEFEKWLKEK